MVRQSFADWESDSVTSGVGEVAKELQDPAARTWRQGWMAPGKRAFYCLQKLHDLEREFAAVGLADRPTRALGHGDPEGGFGGDREEDGLAL